MRIPKGPSLHLRRKRGQDSMALRFLSFVYQHQSQEAMHFCPLVNAVKQCPRHDQPGHFSEDKWAGEGGSEMGMGRKVSLG